MVIGNFEINIKDGIIIVTSKKNVTLDDLREMKTLMEENTGHAYNYGIYRDITGYHDGYDFLKNISVYCGTLNQKVAIDKMLNYKKLQK